MGLYGGIMRLILAKNNSGLTGPTASFVFDGTSDTGSAPHTITLDSTSTIGDAAITNHFWDWGDTNSTNGGFADVSHTYTTAGNYTITLTVTDGNGLQDTFTDTVTVTASTADVNILMLYGSVDDNGNIPAIGTPYHQMRLNDTGNEGLSNLAASINAMTEGGQTFAITEEYDENFNTTTGFAGYDAIFLCSSQKIWSASERTDFVNYVNGGGGLVTMSDSALGGNFSIVGAQNTRGQLCRNPLLENFGMQYHVDQANGTFTETVPAADIIANGTNRSWRGEGVSPIRIDASAGAAQGNPIQVVTNSAPLTHTQNVTYTGDVCALATAELGSGRVAAMWDRNFLWNNGAGTNFSEVDNELVVQRIFKWVTGVISNADVTPPSQPGTPSLVTAQSTSLDITWIASTDNVAVIEYDVYVDGVLGPTIGTNSVTLTGLDANTSYNIYVIAKDAAGNSSTQSATASISTLAAGTVNNLTVGSETTTGAAFSWTGTGTDYEMDIKPIGRDTWVNVYAGATPSHTISTGLHPQVGYQWRVRQTAPSVEAYVEGDTFVTDSPITTGTPQLAMPVPFWESLEVDITTSQIELDFRHPIKLGASPVIELRNDSGGALIKTFNSLEISVGGNWHHKLILSNPALAHDITYTLVITSGSVIDYYTSTAWGGMSAGDYRFSTEKSSYTEMYVSTTGNDGNDGLSLAQAKATIGNAFADASGGTRINVQDGIYRESDIDLASHSNPTNPIIIQGQSRAGTILRGSEAVTTWTNVTGNVWSATFTDSIPSGGTYETQQCWQDGNHLIQIGATSNYHVGNPATGDGDEQLPAQGTDENDLVQGSFYHDGATDTLYVWCSGNEDPNTVLIEASNAWYVMNATSVDGLVVKDMTIEHNGKDIRSIDGIVRTGTRTQWENLTLRYGAFKVINVGSSGRYNQIVGCEIGFGGNTGIDGNNGSSFGPNTNQDCLVKGNSIHDCNYRVFQFDWHSGAIKVIPGAIGWYLIDNYCYEQFGPNLWLDGNRGEMLYEGNYIVGSPDTSKRGHGIFYEVPNLEDTYADWTCTIRNNHIQDIATNQAIYLSACDRVECYSNSAWNSWMPMALHGQPRTIPNGQILTSNDNRIFNNIWENRTGAVGSFEVIYTGLDSTGAPTTGNIVDYNFVHTVEPNSSPNPVITITSNSGYGGTDTGLGPASTACGKGFECNGGDGDAGLISYGTDYRTASTSQQYGKGFFGSNAPNP